VTSCCVDCFIQLRVTYLKLGEMRYTQYIVGLILNWHVLFNTARYFTSEHSTGETEITQS